MCTARTGGTVPSSPGKRAGRQDEAQAGRVGHQPAPHPTAKGGTGTGAGTADTRKGRRHPSMGLWWHLGKMGTTPRGVVGTQVLRTQPGHSAQVSPSGQP